MRLFLLLMAFCVYAEAAPQTMFGLAYPYTNDSSPNPVSVNTSGQLSITKLAGEDQTNDVMKVEEQGSYALDDADLVVKSAAGFVHTFTCWGEDAAATAGSVQLRDATAAGAGTVVFTETFAAAAYAGINRVLDYVMPTGIVIDFATTDDVFCAVSYR